MTFCKRRAAKAAAVSVGLALALALAAALFYGLYLPKKYRHAVAQAAAECGLEEELIFAVIRTESNFRPAAVSRAGAVGLMQLLPSTAAFAESLCGGGADLFDPSQNIRLGSHYLRYLLMRFDDEALALAAYNAGEGTVRRWLREDGEAAAGRFPYAETRRYVAKVKKFYKLYKFFYF